MKITRSITRETDCKELHKPIMVEITQKDLWLWLKGERKRYRVSWSEIYQKAVQGNKWWMRESVKPIQQRRLKP